MLSIWVTAITVAALAIIASDRCCATTSNIAKLIDSATKGPAKAYDATLRRQELQALDDRLGAEADDAMDRALSHATCGVLASRFSTSTSTFSGSVP
jgi:hypothetical protein